MKEISYNKNSISAFYIDLIEDKIIIVSKGNESPFEYLSFLNNALIEYSRFFNTDFKVYIDLLSYTGNTFSRFIETDFLFRKQRIDILNCNYLSEEVLPKSVKKYLKNFHNYRLVEILSGSTLTDNEKRELVNIA